MIPLDIAQARVAVLFQAISPPVLDGVRKDAKPGGYADSGADIAYALRQQGINVVTPVPLPDPGVDLHWAFPDSDVGIEQAVQAGATVLWANTVLFAAHPVRKWLDKVWIVGQEPASQQRFDDKFSTNRALFDLGLPVAPGWLIGLSPEGSTMSLDAFAASFADIAGFSFPAVVKPVRGRGSQGVGVVADVNELLTAARDLIETGRFGNMVMVEPYLAGEELTVTVMPASSMDGVHKEAWCLPPVRRVNHTNGVAPYNGVVAVVSNSAALTETESNAPEVVALLKACGAAADFVGAKAPIRIDCRADASGTYYLFDLNMKPNMTGAGRPGREDQDSLSAIAARAIGWSYADLLRAMLQAAWQY